MLLGKPMRLCDYHKEMCVSEGGINMHSGKWMCYACYKKKFLIKPKKAVNEKI